MTWRVNWLPDAENELADTWLNAPDRDAVTRAAYALDKVLETNPEEAGESRPSSRRILFALPLGIIYRVRADDALVEVIHVWRFRVG